MSSEDDKLGAIVAAAIQTYAGIEGGLMPLLHDLQKRIGYIPKAAVATIASGMGLSRAEVHGVIGFYHDFRYHPHGQINIQICRAEACQAMGSAQLEEHAKNRLGIDFGGISSDGRFSLEPVYCLGNCACTPSIRIGDRVYARVDAERFDEILDEVSA